MNFFEAQHAAKKTTRFLIVIYLFVLLLLTLLSTVVLMYFVPILIGQSVPELKLSAIFSSQHLPMFFGVGAFVLGGALISSYIKSRHLAKGGAVIAASLGGVKITPNTRDISERKVLNVVEEMAIASGMPVPEVFVLTQENSINAFAAGQTPVDAVIGVTQGTIDKLTRNQLQGVIGHEFSHILNGDMRLNLRIILVLHGIEFIGLLGRILTSTRRGSRMSRGRSRGKGNGLAIMIGLALRLIGWVGVLFGNLIQAAVSRQREHLADASAVQFTRDPSSIADALKVIGSRGLGSKINHADVSEAAHMFFGQAFTTRFSSLFATHPPISERIKNLDPYWDGTFLQPLEAPIRELEASEDKSNSALEALKNSMPGLPEPLMLLMAAGVMVNELDQKQQKQLAKLVEQSNDPMEAMALILAVFLLGEKALVDKAFFLKPSWQAMFAQQGIKGLSDLVFNKVKQLQSIQFTQKKGILLPMVELGMPALKQMSVGQYSSFKEIMNNVIMHDGHKSIFEQSIFLLVTRYLDVHFGLKDAQAIKYKKASQVVMELQLLFSCLVTYGHDEAISKLTLQKAYARSMQVLGFANETIIDLQQLSENEKDVELMFNRAVEKLVYCALPLKQQIVEAIAVAVEFDGEVNHTEKELALAIAATMDAPLPRIEF